MHRFAVVLLCAFAPSAISAEPTPQDVAKYRHAQFSVLGTEMMSIGMIVRGTAGAPGDLLSHAIVMHETAKVVGHAFLPGTGSDAVPTSRAAPVIWEDAAGFEVAWQRLVDETGALVKVARRKDVEAVGAQLRQVGAACGSCHDAFRGPEPESEAHEEHHE